jgi:hypothetical protein
LDYSKSSDFWRLAISSAARLSAAERTCRSDVGRHDGLHPELDQKLVIVDLVSDGDGNGLCPCEKPLMIEGFQHSAAIVQLVQTIEARGIQPLKVQQSEQKLTGLWPHGRNR